MFKAALAVNFVFFSHLQHLCTWKINNINMFSGVFFWWKAQKWQNSPNEIFICLQSNVYRYCFSCMISGICFKITYFKFSLFSSFKHYIFLIKNVANATLTWVHSSHWYALLASPNTDPNSFYLFYWIQVLPFFFVILVVIIHSTHIEVYSLGSTCSFFMMLLAECPDLYGFSSSQQPWPCNRYMSNDISQWRPLILDTYLPCYVMLCITKHLLYVQITDFCSIGKWNVENDYINPMHKGQIFIVFFLFRKGYYSYHQNEKSSKYVNWPTPLSSLCLIEIHLTQGTLYGTCTIFRTL
mgnify:CR=1 FL=1